MTVEACRDFCEDYPYFGVENGNECFCGHHYRLPLDIVYDWECPYQCPGDISESCGGELRMNIWSRENTFGEFIGLDNSFLGAQWIQGICYVYNPDNKPLVGDDTTNDENMSIEFCHDYCVSASSPPGNIYKYYAVQGGNYCMCGKEINITLEKAVPQSLCNVACTSEASEEICGGESFFNLYEIKPEE